jgi:hypothetical protein
MNLKSLNKNNSHQFGILTIILSFNYISNNNNQKFKNKICFF